MPTLSRHNYRQRSRLGGGAGGGGGGGEWEASSILSVVLVQELTNKVESSCFSGSGRGRHEAAHPHLFGFFLTRHFLSFLLVFLLLLIGAPAVMP